MFCYFICGPNAFQNSEFEQIENLLQIDLSAFHRFPIYFSPEGDPEYDNLFFKVPETDTEREQINERLQQIKQKYKKMDNETNEGWTPIDEMLELVFTLRQRFEGNPSILKQIVYNNEDFEGYYQFPGTQKKQWYNSFLEDLDLVFENLNKAKASGAVWVAFIVM